MEEAESEQTTATSITPEEKALMEKISKLLKKRDIIGAQTQIMKLIEISNNDIIKSKYSSLLEKLSQLDSEKPQSEEELKIKIEKPSITFRDIKGMQKLKKALSKEVILLLKNRKEYLKHRLKPSGILLYGAPGTGKTMFAEALAGEFGMNIIKPDLATIFSQWVGETEKNIVKIITLALENQPCIIFLDEVDAKIRAREKIEARGESVVSLNATTQFLETMQEVHNGNNQILFMGASNRIWDVDVAAKRPGRLGNLIYVPPPSLKDRFILFRTFLKTVENRRISPFGYLRLALATAKYSASDIEEICIQAKKEMLYRNITSENKDYFLKRFTREEYLSAKANHTLPKKPKETISTRDIIKVINRDFKTSSLDIWYVEAYKYMVGWEETQVHKQKGLIFTKTIKEKVKHEGHITSDERKLYKDMLKDIKKTHKHWLFITLVRKLARIII
ncbi:MAG: ATP-binding protein [Conexivisphaerales archaeon]